MAESADNVNHPSHYAEGWSNGAEVIDITENLNFNLGNAVKYIARAGRKDPSKLVEDLEKARWYLNREINRFDNPPTYRVVREPRVWNKLPDVPGDVSKVVDADEFTWERRGNRWGWYNGDEHWIHMHASYLRGNRPDAPFTEVL